MQPCVALGVGLKASGHEVTVATWAPFRGLVEGSGLSFYPVAGPDPQRLVSALVEAGGNPLEYAGRFRELLRPHVSRGFEETLAACRDADAIIFTPLGFMGYMVSEFTRLPAVGSVVQPLFVPSSRYPSAMLGRPPRAIARAGAPGRVYNHLTHLGVEQLYWRTVQPLVSELRGRVGLPPLPYLRGPFGRMRRERSPLLLGWSKHILPENPEREAWMRTTGYWFLEEETGWRPSRELLSFLGAGEPPVALCLGSMGGLDSRRVGRISDLTSLALGRVGRRGVLLTRGGDLANSSEDLIKIEEDVPYGWLFRRVAVAVHHGGAGTTAEALRAGVPSVVIPVVPDQAFWGWRVSSLGAGPNPIPPGRLTVERLALAIRRAATDAEMRRRARELGEKIAAEDGVGRAVEAFEERVGTDTRR